MSPGSRAPARYGAFGDLEAQLEQLAMDARCSPSWILCDHAKNQIALLLPQGLSSQEWAAARNPRPIQAEAGSVPAHHSFGRNQDERLFPPGPCFAQHDPEQLVLCSQTMARPFGHEEQGEILQDELTLRAENADQPAQEIAEPSSTMVRLLSDGSKRFCGRSC